MPVYEYACTRCGHHFEQYRKINARGAPRCPRCGAPGRKVFLPVGVIFKGSGFHSTDYRTPPAGATQETEKEAPQLASSGSEDSKGGDSD